jgi:hypothetical protein
MAAAQREVWSGSELRRLLAGRAGLELSAASVSALLTKKPSHIKMSTPSTRWNGRCSMCGGETAADGAGRAEPVITNGGRPMALNR